MLGYALRVQVVRTPKTNDAPETPPAKTRSEQFSHVAKDLLPTAVASLGAAYLTKVVLDTSRDVILIVVKSKFH
jgi:hypothetical protein